MTVNKKQETSKLWQKSKTKLNPLVTDYIISKNLDADNQLVQYDIRGSIAHANMLAKQGLIESEEADKIANTLYELAEKHKLGEFTLEQQNEDIHTAIESYLVATLGDIGKKIHLGRSRNDQVLTAMRLYMKDNLQATQVELIQLVGAFLSFAKKYEFTPLTGFTHMQHAMPSSVGMWAACFVEGLIDDYDCLGGAYKLIDKNPLGSAAGFGSSVPLDRMATTTELGFAKLQQNPIYCQNSRGKFEAYVINSLMQVMMTLGKFANDMVIFCSQEFGFMRVDDSLTTGSSIMPQKKNLDIMEVARANLAVIQSLQIQCQTVTFNLISGYNKDLKITKKPLMEAFDITRKTINICKLLIENTKPVTDNLLRAFDDVEIFAADYANDLVMNEGMSFRDAYRKIGEELKSLEKQDPIENIKTKTHQGSTGNLGLEIYEKWLANLQ